MTTAFDRAFDRLIGNEGGLVDNPSDPGGLTQWGISQRSYPAADIRALTREDARAIYLKDFWLRGRMDEYDPAIAFQVFDFAVNSGIETALRALQRAALVADDGHIGPVTVATIKETSVTDIIMRFIAERLIYWTGLSTWSEFGRGWARRAAKDLRYGAEDA